MSETKVAPEIIGDSDGLPIALRRDLAPNPRKAFVYVICDGFEWLIDDVAITWTAPGEEHARYVLSDMRGFVDQIKPDYMRPWDGKVDDLDSEWGDQTWYWCDADHSAAVEYWKLPW